MEPVEQDGDKEFNVKRSYRMGRIQWVCGVVAIVIQIFHSLFFNERAQDIVLPSVIGYFGTGYLVGILVSEV